MIAADNRAKSANDPVPAASQPVAVCEAITMPVNLEVRRRPVGHIERDALVQIFLVSLPWFPVTQGRTTWPNTSASRLIVDTNTPYRSSIAGMEFISFV